LIFGVDPGFSGAIAGIGDGFAFVVDMPTVPGAKGKTELNHGQVLGSLQCGSESVVWLERVGARPGQGVSSMFRFGQQLGALEMAVACHGHVLRYVTPAVWKAYFGLSADKGTARGYAIKRFPALADQLTRAKDDGRAEALLIALYGMEHAK
jgi:crossover junction endodeoxyribonuclease RuvC